MTVRSVKELNAVPQNHVAKENLVPGYAFDVHMYCEFVCFALMKRSLMFESMCLNEFVCLMLE